MWWGGLGCTLSWPYRGLEPQTDPWESSACCCLIWQRWSGRYPLSQSHSWNVNYVNFKSCLKSFEFRHLTITGQNGVHLVREISPWSSQVLCIGLAQNLKPILSDDKYWNINPNISAFGMWLICDNTWMYNIQAYAWMYHIQAFAWPQIWPNPIPNPIHGCNTFKIFEHMYALKYQQIWPNPISNPIHGLAIIKF